MRKFRMKMFTMLMVFVLIMSPITTFASTMSHGGGIDGSVSTRKIIVHTMVVVDQVKIEGSEDHFQRTENCAFTEEDIAQLQDGIDLSGEESFFLQGFYWDATGTNPLKVGDVASNGDTLYILLTTVEPTVSPNPPQNPPQNQEEIPSQTPEQNPEQSPPVDDPADNSSQEELPTPQPEVQTPTPDAPKTGQMSFGGVYVVFLFGIAVLVAGVKRSW